MPVFSRRSWQHPEQNALSEALAVSRSQGQNITDLTVSNPTLAMPEARPDVSAPIAAAAQVDYRPQPLGDLAARRRLVAHWQQIGVESREEDIALCASTSEAYSILFKLLCDSDDEVLVPRPSYPLFEQLAQFDQVRLVPYQLAYDGAWHIDTDSVRSSIGPATRAIIVVNPNNPTGSYLTRDEVEHLRDFELPLISDEVFARYPIDARPFASASTAVLSGSKRMQSLTSEATGNSLVISLDGLSKYAGLPQLKLAWMTLSGARSLVEEARFRLEFLLDAYLSVSTPIQGALGAILDAALPTHEAIRRRISENYQRLRERLADTQVTPLTTQGGWSQVLQLPATRSDEEWALLLLQQHGVLVQPGWFYDFTRGAHVVISLLTPPDVLSEGCERLLGACERA